jgi:hypothetical protein
LRTLILSLAGMLAAHAAMAGGIDTSFGTSGLVTFDPGTGASTQP